MSTSSSLKKIHPYRFFVEALAERPGYVQRPMFGCQACYLDGKLVLVLAAREEPWRGLLFPSERDQHAAILANFPELAPHPVLPKWLYIPETHDAFEPVGQRIVALIDAGDPRFGVVPPAKKKRKTKS